MMSSPPDTRASLILRLPDQADSVAWDEFVAIYSPLVYRLARRQGLQAADADDLVQEVMGAVTRSVEGWLERADRGRFRAWLLRIARNTAINFLTRRKHRPQAIGGENVVRAVAECIEDSDASREFDWEYRREVFRWAAEQVQTVVTDETWRAFWLTSVEEQSVADTAQRLGLSVGSVYIARSRVMSRLRELVRQFDECERP
jgi:RNA polymerase sigma-70 factor (ECF subfamily)